MARVYKEEFEKLMLINKELKEKANTYSLKVQRLQQERNLLLDKVYVKMLENGEFDFDKNPHSSGNIDAKIVSTASNTSSKSAAPKPPHKPKEKKRKITKSSPKIFAAVPRNKDNRPLLPISIGQVTLHSLGTLNDPSTQHSTKYLWPAGYHCSRLFLSPTPSENQSVYNCFIEAGPLFKVECEGRVWEGQTPSDVWTSVLKDVYGSRGREYASTAGGPEMYGLNNPTISLLLEELEGVSECNRYKC